MYGRRGIEKPQSEADLQPYRQRFTDMFARLRSAHGVRSHLALEWFRNPDLKFREQAFARSTILLATVAVASAALLLATRHWWVHGIRRRQHRRPVVAVNA